MVSFQCDGCGDVVKKPKLNQHRNRCYATFTCIDCSVTFEGTSYQSHNSCMTEAEKFQKHIYKNKNNNTKDAPKNVEETAKKPVSIIEQLNEKKRKNEESVEEKKKEESNNKKSKKDEESKNKKSKKNLASWSSTELDVDESKNLKNALKEVLKEGKSLSLKDVRKKTIQLIEKHPKYKKSDLKKSFEKTFTLTLKDNVIIFE